MTGEEYMRELTAHNVSFADYHILPDGWMEIALPQANVLEEPYPRTGTSRVNCISTKFMEWLEEHVPNWFYNRCVGDYVYMRFMPPHAERLAMLTKLHWG